MMRKKLWLAFPCALLLVGVITGAAIAAIGGEARDQSSTELTEPGISASVAESSDRISDSALAVLDLDSISKSAATMVTDWIDHGVNVLAATTDESDPSRITINVPSEDIRGPEGMTTYDQIERRAAIQFQAGLDITWVDVVEVKDDGEEGLYTGFLVSDLVPKSDWSTSPALTEDAAGQALEDVVAAAATEAESLSVHSVSFGTTEEDGRVAGVVAIVPLGGVDTQGQFLDQVHLGVAELNRQEGAAIALLTIDVVDPDGKLLVRELDDFALADGGVRAGWVAPELRKPLFQPGFMD